MKALLKNRPLLLLNIGLVLMATSPLWEYVRNRPDFRFVIRPWSMRGYEFSQGKVIAAGAIAILVIAWLLHRGILKENRAHSAITVGAVIVFAVAATILSDARDVEVPFIGSAVLSLIGMGIAGTYISRYVPESLPGWARRLIGVFARIAVFFVLLLFVLHPLIGGSGHPAWFVAIVVFLFIGGLSLARPPVELAPWRTLINAILAVWALAITMGASLRADLIRAQFEVNSVSAELSDVQITSGVLLAWIGGLIAFVGAVGLWAQRRDEIAARDRARKQQEAARESEGQMAGQTA